MTSVSVRRLGREDWRLLRAVRLAALAESPSAFLSSLDTEATWDEEQWSLRAPNRAVAIVEEVGVGMIGWARHDDFLELIGLWVHPDHRGGRVAVQLVHFVRNRVALPARDEIRLAVLESNSRALRFYERSGFVVLDRVGRDAPPMLVWMSLPAELG